MDDYLEQLQQRKHFWLQPVFNSLPALCANRTENPLSFNRTVGAQKELSLFHSHSVWKPPTPSSSARHVDYDSDSSSFSSIVSSASLLPWDHKELNQISRNVLITDIPQNHYKVIVQMVNAIGGINDMLEQTYDGYVTLVVIFYDLRHTSDLYTALSQFLQTNMDLWHVGLDVCDNQLVASLFDIPWNEFQDTHLSVNLRGNPWALTAINYKHLMESYGCIRYYKQPDFSDNTVHLVVEYLDTRVAVTTQKALDGMVMKDVIFHAHLFKPEAIRNQSLTDRVPLQVIPSINKNSPWSSRLEVVDNVSLTFDDHENLELSFFSQHSTLSPFAAITTHQSSSTRSVISTQQSNKLQPISFHGTMCPSVKEKITPGDNGGMTIRNHGFPTQTKYSSAAPALSCYTIPLASNASTDNDDSETTSTPMSRCASSSASYSTISDSSFEPPKTKIVTRRQQQQQSNIIDLNRIINKEDTRTTFMIRNIPNKYNQAMLMECIDATHKGTYDFLYLRIDFQNKCNVGYAFINFMVATSVVTFAEQRIGKQWNRFNSGKICELSYANIQGKANLIQKFRNSTVMTHDITYRPKIFYSSGIHKGNEQPFPEPDRHIPARFYV